MATSNFEAEQQSEGRWEQIRLNKNRACDVRKVPHTHNIIGGLARATSTTTSALFLPVNKHLTLTSHFSTSSNPTHTKHLQYADPAPSTHSIAPVSNKSTAMSAPNAGRQSPEPENQSSKQQAAPTAGNPNQQGAEPNEGSKQASDNQKDGLSSNPTGPLDQAAKDKTSKST
ncbi:hypothetical protein D6D04_05782 [Aureobasidium pullulans]|nr:hypothetical protein D6D04_05782 [Aureobasidium pullulans]